MSRGGRPFITGPRIAEQGVAPFVLNVAGRRKGIPHAEFLASQVDPGRLAMVERGTSSRLSPLQWR